MTATIQKWGHSLALKIPRKLAEQMRLGKGDPVEIEAVDGALIVRASRPRYRLADLVAGINPTNRHSETDWTDPRSPGLTHRNSA